MYKLIALLLSVTVAPALAQPFGLGRTPDKAEKARVSISVAPDGTGLPRGRGTPATGRGVYEAKCASCHGAKGEGGPGFPRLVGGVGSLKSAQPVATIGSYWPYATTVWDYINRAMPYQDAGSLRPDEVYAVTAYLLHLNGIIKEGSELNERNLARVEMPNKAGFVDDPRPAVH